MCLNFIFFDFFFDIFICRIFLLISILVFNSVCMGFFCCNNFIIRNLPLSWHQFLCCPSCWPSCWYPYFKVLSRFILFFLMISGGIFDFRFGVAEVTLILILAPFFILVFFFFLLFALDSLLSFLMVFLLLLSFAFSSSCMSLSVLFLYHSVWCWCDSGSQLPLLKDFRFVSWLRCP